MGLIEYLDWDSHFFGFNIGRVAVENSQRLSPSLLNDVLAEAYSRHMKCLYIEISFGHHDMLACCSKEEFSLVDFKIILGKKLQGEDIKGTKNLSYLTRERRGEYFKHLEKIIEEVSSQSRYSSDPRFGGIESLRLYREWLRKSFYESFSEEFIIYLEEGVPSGFITLRNRNGVPFIDLLGVSKDKQGRGVGTCLIKAAEESVLMEGYKTVKVTTQGHNFRALKAYQSRDFMMESMNILYHKWID